jgi:hypothetical protein
MKRTSFLSAMLLGLAMGAGAVYAHDDATLNTVKAPSGGQLRMAGIYHYELVVAKDSKDAKDNPVVVYVTDHVENPHHGCHRLRHSFSWKRQSDRSAGTRWRQPNERNGQVRVDARYEGGSFHRATRQGGRTGALYAVGCRA